MQKNIYGKRSEIIAQNYLKKQGYKIIDTNYSTKLGEIDIIAKDKNGYIVFIEVKSRMSKKLGDPFEAINVVKQQKIKNVATMYLKSHNMLDVNCRFDAIAILGENDDEIRHIIDAF